MKNNSKFWCSNPSCIWYQWFINWRKSNKIVTKTANIIVVTRNDIVLKLDKTYNFITTKKISKIIHVFIDAGAATIIKAFVENLLDNILTEALDTLPLFSFDIGGCNPNIDNLKKYLNLINIIKSI